MNAATVSEHDRYVAAVEQLRALCAELPASVHAALDHDAVLARDAAYPHLHSPRKAPLMTTTAFRHIHHEEWLVSFGDHDHYHTDHGDQATAEREAAIARANGEDAHATRKRICLWANPYAEGEVRGVDRKPLAEMIRPPAEDLKAVALLLSLVRYVEQTGHRYASGVSLLKPLRPGKDCAADCRACALLTDVPADLLAQVRAETAADERTEVSR